MTVVVEYAWSAEDDRDSRVIVSESSRDVAKMGNVFTPVQTDKSFGSC